jgi:hypothetical protein
MSIGVWAISGMTMARLHVATGSRWRRTVRIAGKSAFLLDNAGERLSKYATDDRGQKDQRNGQEQSGNNLFSQRNAASSSGFARLTAQIEFGGPQFPLQA